MTTHIDRHTYRVVWSDEDGEYVGTCLEFSSLSWLDRTPELALTGIRNIVAASRQDMEKSGELMR